MSDSWETVVDEIGKLVEHLEIGTQDCPADGHAWVNLSCRDWRVLIAALRTAGTGRAEAEEIPAIIASRYAEVDADRLGRLERELGVKGTVAVFRESLRLAKEALGEAAIPARDDVVSARLTAWKDGYGGVDLTFASGRRVALALDAPHEPTEVS